jgi:hypothetical protein
VLCFLGLLPAYLAWRKGRSFGTWWLFGATLLPVALPAALMLAPVEPDEASAALKASKPLGELEDARSESTD